MRGSINAEKCFLKTKNRMSFFTTRFETCWNVQSCCARKNQKQLLSIAMEMIRRIVLSRIKPPQMIVPYR